MPWIALNFHKESDYLCITIYSSSKELVKKIQEENLAKYEKEGWDLRLYTEGLD